VRPGRRRPRARARAAAVLLGAAVTAGPASGQQVTHLGASAAERLTEIVELVEPWADAADRELHGSASRDVQVRLLRRGADSESEEVHLLLFGAWGAHLYTYDAALRRQDGVRELARRTERLAADVDDDGEAELILVERSLQTERLVDEAGDELPEPGPFFASYQVEVRYLDRRDGALLEESLPADSEDPRFRALLALGLPDAVRTALQQAAGDADFAAHRFEQAAYRYRTVREWAERALPGGDAARLGPRQPLFQADPDDPTALWLAARHRADSLPLAFRRR
jgi:hypothetical protein